MKHKFPMVGIIIAELVLIILLLKEGKHISMDTLARICETLDCGIMDVIELASDEPSATRGNDNGKTERKNHRERH